jgi:putative hydrolase of the HAD superfamily
VSDIGLENLFDVMVFSCDVGVAKPDEKIYKIALEKLGVKPEECLFIGDDVKNDVGGPRKIGMKSFLINRKYHGEDNIQSLKGVLDLIDWE